MGFICPERQTTSDFLTSLSNPEERIVREGFEHLVPQTPGDFAKVWKNSGEYRRLIRSVEAYSAGFPLDGQASKEFGEPRKAEQARHQ